MTEYKFKGRGRRRSPDLERLTWCVVTEVKPLSEEERARVRAENEEIERRRRAFGLY